MFPSSHAHNTAPFLVDTTILELNEYTDSGLGSEKPGLSWVRYYTFELDVTEAATTSGDTLDVYIQRKTPAGNWDDVLAFPQVLGDGGAKNFVADVFIDTADMSARAPTDANLSAGTERHVWIGDSLRVKYVINDETTDDAAFTFAVYMRATA